jgi:hypothetical protein
LPILTEGGMDVKLGRMNTIIGYNGFLAPYRPMYSSDYQFFYSQDGAFRAATTAFDLRHQCNRQVLERIPLKCSGIHTVGYDSDIRVR